MRSAARLLAYAQLALLLGLAICLILLPHFLFESNEGGISNFGTYAKTIVPFTLGFGACGLLTIWATFSLPRNAKSYKDVRSALLILGVLYLFVLGSTYAYKVNHILDMVHVYASIALVIWNMVFGTWLSLFVVRDSINITLICIQFVAFTLAVLTYVGTVHTLFIAEVLLSAAFGVLLVRSIHMLQQRSKEAVTR